MWSKPGPKSEVRGPTPAALGVPNWFRQGESALAAAGARPAPAFAAPARRRVERARALVPLGIVALAAIGLAVRLWVLRTNDELSSDEVLPGLMALHIAQGKEAPVFFYGQHYFGTLEAYFVAGLFKLVGFDPWLLLVPPMVASLALVPLTYALGAKLAGRTAGVLACVPLAVPPPVLAKLFTNAGGGFSLAFALQAAVLLCCLQALPAGDVRRPSLGWLAAGSLLSGFLCWIWQPALLLYAVLWVVLAAGLALWRRPAWLLAGTAPVLLGLAPALWYNAARGWPTLAQVGAKYFAPANEATSGDWAGPRAVATFLFTALGGGNEAEGGANPLQAGLIAAALPLTALLLARPRRCTLPKGPEGTAGARRTVAAVLALAAVVDVAGAHSTVRHLVPAALIGYPFLGAAPALLVGRLPRRLKGAGWTLAAFILAVCVVAPNLWLDAHAGGIFQRFTASTAEVRQGVAALAARGLHTGYTDYWSAYPIVFFSGESVVLAPSLPVVWGGRFDRYPAYTDAVDAEDDLRRVFVLLDNRCSPLPYMLILEQHDARYAAERVARWYLLWDVQAPEGESAEILAAWRQLLASRQIC